jgi:hypothetical protein
MLCHGNPGILKHITNKEFLVGWSRNRSYLMLPSSQWSGKFWHGSGSSDPFPKNESGYLQLFMDLDIKVIFLVVLKCKKIILPCQKINFVKQILQYFAKFGNFLLYEISQNCFFLARNAKWIFREREILSTTLVFRCSKYNCEGNVIFS